MPTLGLKLPLAAPRFLRDHLLTSMRRTALNISSQFGGDTVCGRSHGNNYHRHEEHRPRSVTPRPSRQHSGFHPRLQAGFSDGPP
ncbi:hypothetical protein BGY98DRAFT_984817 [Russula aff. rugulosa BPL654]|nr:hypothetical protein BGY98DRAFT_984817 [Russula aff. rugulosa BPL654]